MSRSLNTSSAHGVPGNPRTLPHVSASQVKTYRTCPRKWALEKLWFERAPQTVAQGTGQAIHTVNEGYLVTGEFPEGSDPTHIAIVRQAAEAGNLPPPGPGLFIEHEIKLATKPGLPSMLGYIDLINARTPPVLVLDDHKTTSDFKYALSPEDLSNDVQMTTYAAWGYSPDAALFLAKEFDKAWEDGVEEVEISHIYQHKKIRASKRVAVRVPYAQVARNWVSIVDTIEEMDTLAKAPPVNPLEIQGNSQACGAYGGCPHRSRCGVTKSQFNIRISSERKDMERKTESLKERIARRKAEQAAGGAAPAADDAGLTPPDAAPRTAQAEFAAEPTKIVTKGPDDKQATVEVETAAPKKRAGRPRKEKAAPVEAPHPGTLAYALAEPDDATTAPVQRPEALSQEEKPAAPVDVDTLALEAFKRAQEAIQKGPVLFIDCYVAGGSTGWENFQTAIPLETWLRGVADDVAKEFGVSHYGLIEYGKGKAALAAGIKIAMDAGMCPPVVSVDTRIPGADVFLEVATASAALIIKGCR